ncbi:hypothetical protein JAAARDRAFT_41232 [Jaapia argillacea MUCL 33604]|uniref:RNA helicase n=1 Tax=Jaapia argillacea MUCL 33604 TaxID=933084 RepID=A0A067P9C9_9AGAM|nr:hypothetical protein JAAARDRAFT_41232 [Jaapia argillacea MUCL 33604]
MPARKRLVDNLTPKVASRQQPRRVEVAPRRPSPPKRQPTPEPKFVRDDLPHPGEQPGTSDSSKPSPSLVLRRARLRHSLEDELQLSPKRLQPIKDLPRSFGPPLLRGLVESVRDVLGPSAVPTPIQSLAIKHLVPDSKTSNVHRSGLPSHQRWHQCLLASETGSGKSFAYLLPLLHNLKRTEMPHNSPHRQAQLHSHLPSPRGLIIAPTHELSRQLTSFAKSLTHIEKLRVRCASRANLPNTSRSSTASKMSGDTTSAGADGDASAEFEVRPPRETEYGRNADLLVGTPMKLLDMVRGYGWDRQPETQADPSEEQSFFKREPELNLEKIEYVVVDEADVLFDPDFLEYTQMLLSDISEARGRVLPESPEDRGVRPGVLMYPFHFIMTTATIPASLASYLDTHHPNLIRLASPKLHQLPSSLKTEHVGPSTGNRNSDVEKRIRRVWDEDAHQGRSEKSKVLVFCNRSTKVEELGKYLEEKGIPNLALTSTSEARSIGSNRHLAGFLKPQVSSKKQKDPMATSSDSEHPVAKPKETPNVLITTSLLSRGLDFSPSLTHVFMLDEPRNQIDFLHRAGRTGRAGEQGTVVVFGKGKMRGSVDVERTLQNSKRDFKSSRGRY